MPTKRKVTFPNRNHNEIITGKQMHLQEKESYNITIRLENIMVNRVGVK